MKLSAPSVGLRHQHQEVPRSRTQVQEGTRWGRGVCGCLWGLRARVCVCLGPQMAQQEVLYVGHPSNLSQGVCPVQASPSCMVVPAVTSPQVSLVPGTQDERCRCLFYGYK